MSLPNMRPVPPTPAMPRFADTSLLMMTEPIFGDATLDDDDWLEPPTPGPSRIAAPKSVIRNKMLDRDAYVPIVEEDEDTQDRIGEDELQIPEEEMFSGRGEKPVERVGGAFQSANTSLPRTSSPVISQHTTSADTVVGPIPSVVDHATSRQRVETGSRQISLSTALVEFVGNEGNMSAESLDSTAGNATATTGSTRTVAKTSASLSRRLKAAKAEIPSASTNNETTAKLAVGLSPPKPKSALSRYLARTSTRPAPATAVPVAPPMKSSAPQGISPPPSRAGDMARRIAALPTRDIPPTTDLFSPAVSSIQVNKSERSHVSGPCASTHISAPPHSRVSSIPSVVSTASSSRTPSTLSSQMNTVNDVRATTPVAAPSVFDVREEIIQCAKPPEAGPSSLDTTTNPEGTPKAEGLIERFTGFLRRSRSSLSLSSTPGQESTTRKREREDENKAGDNHTETIKKSEDNGPEPSGESVEARMKQPARRPEQASSRPIPGYAPLTRPSHRPPPTSRTAAPVTSSTSRQPVTVVSRKPPVPKARPASSSAFAQAAIARLPAPGKGSTGAAGPVRVRTPERARDLAKRRKVFESANTNLPRTGTTHIAAPVRAGKVAATGKTVGGITLTKPVVGHTPGKASKMRAAQRDKFDAAVKEKMEAQERERREAARKREEEEEEAYQRRRKETVIWAKPVPALYRPGAAETGRGAEYR